MPAALTFTPRAMGATLAAQYIGVSESTLRALGIPRKKNGGRFLYDRVDLDAYVDSLPYEGAAPEKRRVPKQWSTR